MIDRAQKMTEKLTDDMVAYGSAYSNWANLLIRFTYPFYEIVFTGEQALANKKDFQNRVFANYLSARFNKSSLLSLATTQSDEKSFIYICRNHSCLLPVESVSEAIATMNSEK